MTEKIKIKFSEDYSWMKSIYESDIKLLREYNSITMFSDYHGTWQETYVTLEELNKLIKNGCSIKINC